MKLIERALAITLMTSAGAGAFAGCGGESDSNDAVDTGLPPDKPLSDVTSEEATQACERLSDSFGRRFNEDTVTQSFCTLYAAALASTPDSCNDIRDACVEEAAQPGSDLMMALDFEALDFGCGTADLSNCGDATVGELETCFNDTFNLLDATLNRYSCADAAMVEMDDLGGIGEFEPAQSCEVVSCGVDGPFG